MNDLVEIVECPRDAWQALPRIIPPAQKAEYLRRLVSAGFQTIDAVSFVSPFAVPQMADSEEVLALLDPASEGTKILAIVMNEQGAKRAIATDRVHTLGFPYSISPQFLERNQRQTLEQALAALSAITQLAHSAGLEVVAYISMAFGNPYGDPWNCALLRDACSQLVEMGVRQISLADTVGLASPAQIAEVLAEAMAAQGTAAAIGVHLHSRPQDASAKIAAAYRAGCRRFDAALGGLGGCPFAQDTLVGNIATETLLAVLVGLGAKLPAIAPLGALIATAVEIGSEFGEPSVRPQLHGLENPA